MRGEEEAAREPPGASGRRDFPRWKSAKRPGRSSLRRFLWTCLVLGLVGQAQSGRSAETFTVFLPGIDPAALHPDAGKLPESSAPRGAVSGGPAGEAQRGTARLVGRLLAGHAVLRGIGGAELGSFLDPEGRAGGPRSGDPPPRPPGSDPGERDAPVRSGRAPGVILLLPEALEALAPRRAELLHALEAARGLGMPLVAAGRAAELAGSLERPVDPPQSPATPDASPVGTPLRGEGGVAAPGRAKAPTALVVAALDQSHPMTQCVTHLLLSQVILTGPEISRGGPDTSAAGQGLLLGFELKDLEQRRAGLRGDPAPQQALPPARWRPLLGLKGNPSRPGGLPAASGREAVLAFELGPEATASEELAYAFLLARTLEWLIHGSVESRIPEGLPLLAESPAVELEALLPGLPGEQGYYRGREVAPVMSFHGADWLDRPDREESEEPDRVVAALEIPTGAQVADVGAGTGYFTFRLARRVGPLGKVLATDIQPEMLEILEQRRKALRLDNVSPVLATETATGLPDDQVDLILLVDVYHELARPQELLDALRRALRPAPDPLPGGTVVEGDPGARGARSGRRAGRLVLIEYRGEDPRVPIRPLHRTTTQQVKAEIEPRGFKLVEKLDFLRHQHVLIFERTESLAQPRR